MSNISRDVLEFGSSKPLSMGDLSRCAECEGMLADALDGTLSVEEQLNFDQHVLSCAGCAELLADAQRGAAWLEMLRDPRPEPPALLVERILQRTKVEVIPITGFEQPMAVAGELPYAAASLPTGTNLYVLPVRGKSMLRSLHNVLIQPRLAMTAAMAFFSVGLTLNLTGVQLNELHTRELKPSSLRRTFYQANASVIRYYDNLRVVYELESRVRELQRTGDNEPTPTKAPANEPDSQQKRATPRPGSGSSHRQRPSAGMVTQTLALLHYGNILIEKGERA